MESLAFIGHSTCACKDGVNVPCSTSKTRLLYCLFFSFSCSWNFCFGDIFAALRMRYGGKGGLSVISHISLGGQNDFLIKLSCFLSDLTV